MPAKSLSGAGDVFSRTRGVHVVGTVEMRGDVVGEQEECAESERGERFDRVGDVRERDVFGQEERDGERKRDGCQSGDFEREENSRRRVRGSERE